MLRFSGFFFEKSNRVFIPEGSSCADKLTVSKVTAYFIVTLASYLGRQHERVIDETIIIAILFKNLISKRTNNSETAEIKWIAGQMPGLPAELNNSDKNALIDISPSFLDHFLEDFFPSYLRATCS